MIRIKKLLPLVLKTLDLISSTSGGDAIYADFEYLYY